MSKGEPVLGENLMKLRKKQGISQQEAADLLGVTRQTISNWECGQGAPSLDKAAELARLYHVKLDDLSNDVEVVTASQTSVDKDLHLLFGLKGKTCKLGFSDDYLILAIGSYDPCMTVLDANEDWLRVEYERGTRTKKENVVQLIEVSAVESVRILGDVS